MSSWMTSLVVWGVSIYRGRTGETPAFRHGEYVKCTQLDSDVRFAGLSTYQQHVVR